MRHEVVETQSLAWVACAEVVALQVCVSRAHDASPSGVNSFVCPLHRDKVASLDVAMVLRGLAQPAARPALGSPTPLAHGCVCARAHVSRCLLLLLRRRLLLEVRVEDESTGVPRAAACIHGDVPPLSKRDCVLRDSSRNVALSLWKCILLHQLILQHLLLQIIPAVVDDGCRWFEDHRIGREGGPGTGS